MKRVWAIAFMLALGFGSTVLAGANPDAKALIHVERHESRTCLKNFPEINSLTDVYTYEESRDVDAFPVFFDLSEYKSFDYALWWPGTYSCALVSCSDLTTGTITWPWDGVSHAWYSCQPGPIAVVGWGWIYDIGCICMMSHPAAHAVTVTDCDGKLDTVKFRYFAEIGGYYHWPGDPPCCPADSTPTDPTSWGEIKTLFR